MRTVTTTTEIYEYAELSDKAKEDARVAVSHSTGYLYEDDAIKSLEGLCEHFNGKITRSEVDFSGSCHSWADFYMPQMDESEIEERLNQLGSYNPETLKGVGECVLTGYCADEDAIDGFRQAWHEGERDLNKLMQSAFGSWLRACQFDYNAFYDDDDHCFGDYAAANDLEFLVTGDPFGA